MQGQKFRPHGMRFGIALAKGMILKSHSTWLSTYLSVFRGFIVSLQRALKTRNASLMNKSFNVGRWVSCSCLGDEVGGMLVSELCLG